MSDAKGRLSGKIAYITGAGAGIGRAAAELFARIRATVIIAEFNTGKGQAVADAINAAGGKAKFVRTDVTSEEKVRESIDAAVQFTGRIDVLYNNAGASTAIDAQVIDCPAEEFWRAIKLDLFGMWITCKYGIAAMVKTGGGSVINCSSAFALVGTREGCLYSSEGRDIVHHALDGRRVCAALHPGELPDRAERCRNDGAPSRFRRMENDDQSDLSDRRRLFDFVSFRMGQLTFLLHDRYRPRAD
ncbi:NADP-dependent 3-hydroxy acid dehydrogenase YdfG [Paraburkholderia sp. HC6.4b]|nr:NADP-dependent 3-hydroxy acid dehydrogenase YdfG [Paraburkholderia sp. HC6.4b]MBB5448698.1 NADP-dependent 3-hydroxy acid dehydrogenase YdfG [Paraburkholderia sp. Kb1A]